MPELLAALDAFMQEHRRERFTGFVDLRLTYIGVGIVRLIPMRQDSIEPAAEPKA